MIRSPDARADLSDGTTIWGLAAGALPDGIVPGIFEVCALLEAHPFAGRARNEVRPGLRSMAASPHVVFYRVNDDVAEIVRVLDGRRDLDEVFAHEP